jgi:hypothetical protein
MTFRKRLRAIPLVIAGLLPTGVARAQDVPGIEICTVEKDMARRTGCLQSNVEFLKKTMTQMTLDHQRKLDAASRQIEALRATVASLQKDVEALQASQKKPEPAKDDKAAAKDGGGAKK